MSRGRYFAALAGAILACAAILTGCGDDPEISIPVITPYRVTSEERASRTGEEQQAEEKQQAGEEQQEEEVLNRETKEQSAETSEILDFDSEETESDDPPQPCITVSAAGDVSMGNYKDQKYPNSFRETYDLLEDKSYFFENVRDVFEKDDFTIVNLEGVLTLSEKFAEGRTYNIKGDPEYVELLKDGSIEAVSMGNNHRLDYGEEGTRDTVQTLEEAGIPYAYDGNVGVYETEGIRIGWVSVNEASQGKSVEKYLKDGIGRLQEDGVDLILACCHWGTERDYYPEEYQKELGRKCIDWGADLVIGHHPHVLQGIDQYQGKYIVYSLGNFCFGANKNPDDKDTMIFQQTFTFEDGEAQPGEARVIPCSISSVSNRNNYQPTPLTGGEYDRVIGRINEFSRDFGVSADENGVLVQEETP